MNRFEYKIEKYPSEEFTHLVYFCTGNGECKFDQLPSDQVKVLESLMNEQGEAGWELVQTVFGEEGVVTFWKRNV